MSTPRIDETISKQEDDSWAVWFTSLIAVLKEQYNYTKLPIPKQKEFDQLLINLPLNISETKNKILQLEPQLAKDILEKTERLFQSRIYSIKNPNLLIKQSPLKDAYGILQVTNYRENVEKFAEIQPFFFDETKSFWFWNFDKYCYEMFDETDVLNSIDNELLLSGDTITPTIKQGYLEAFRRVGRHNMPIETKKSWVQFHNKYFDVENNAFGDVTPTYWFANPIPWQLSPVEDANTPTIDKLFEEWVGVGKVKMLKQVIAYCCYPDYPLHIICCLVGSGRNGKTQFTKFLTNFLDMSNVVSTELDLLIDSRFESAKMFKKLVAVMGETNFGTIKRTSLLKKLTGGDLISAERKGKALFDFYNYAKLIIASNSLPKSDDVSEGFYRRWVIINFDNEFEEGKDVINNIPEVEYCALARQITHILPEIISKGKLEGVGTIQERKERYMKYSNALPEFLRACCELNPDKFIRFSILYTVYSQYLHTSKRRVVSKKEFSMLLNEEGFEVRHTNKRVGGEFENTTYIEGVCLVEGYEKGFVHGVPDVRLTSSLSSYSGLSEISATTDTSRTITMQAIEIKNKALQAITNLDKVNNGRGAELAGIEGFWAKEGQPVGGLEEYLTKLKAEGEIYEIAPTRYKVLK